MMFTDWRWNVRLTNSDPVYLSRERVRTLLLEFVQHAQTPAGTVLPAS